MSITIKEPLFAEERQTKILQLLKQKHKLLVPDLCEYFTVSPATIRNDLNDLESKGLLKRTHGGAISNIKTGFEPNSMQKQVANSWQKERIAKYAASLVEDGDTIAIDTGTTMLALTNEILSKKNLTVVTNDIKIASLLEECSGASIIFTGGAIRKGFHCAVGPLTIAALSTLRVDKSFIATNGLTLDSGLSTPDLNQAEVKRHLTQIGAQTILLCDSSKIGNNSFANFASLEAIDFIITDDGIDKRYLDMLNKNEVRVEVVSE